MNTPWPVLLSVAAPFVIALGIVGRYFMRKIDERDKEIKNLYDKMQTDTLTVITQATASVQNNTAALKDLLEFVESVKTEVTYERELRIRMEERLRELLRGRRDENT